MFYYLPPQTNEPDPIQRKGTPVPQPPDSSVPEQLPASGSPVTVTLEDVIGVSLNEMIVGTLAIGLMAWGGFAWLEGGRGMTVAVVFLSGVYMLSSLQRKRRARRKARSDMKPYQH